MPNSIPILTYHALHAPAWTYSTNDHVALERDLGLVRELGFRVAPLSLVAQAVIEGRVPELAAERVVGISFDDGTDHDWIDFSHPDYGYLKSMARVVREQGQDLGFPGGPATATSFVIVSPQARAQLDRSCIAGRGQWRDDWWLEAAREGTLSIANHSWDHLHPTLDAVVARHAERGRFDSIRTFADAEAEIGEAERFLQVRTGGLSPRLLAYPYGAFNDYLTGEYLDSQSEIRAAFACGGRHVDAQASRWAIPRFTCQEHWQSPEQLADILRSS